MRILDDIRYGRVLGLGFGPNRDEVHVVVFEELQGLGPQVSSDKLLRVIHARHASHAWQALTRVSPAAGRNVQAALVRLRELCMRPLPATNGIKPTQLYRYAVGRR